MSNPRPGQTFVFFSMSDLWLFCHKASVPQGPFLGIPGTHDGHLVLKGMQRALEEGEGVPRAPS